MTRRLLLMLMVPLLAGLVGCRPAGEGAPDAGDGMDAGTRTRDAGRPDGGGGPDAGTPPPPPTEWPGFTSRDDIPSGTDGPHLAEFVTDGTRVWVANTLDAIASYSLAGGTLTLVQGRPEVRQPCTSIALHAPSKTLVCGAFVPGEGPNTDDWGGSLSTYTWDATGAATLATAFAAFESDGLEVRDLAFHGDRLVIVELDGRVRLGTLEIDGSISLVTTTLDGNFRTAASDGTHLVLLDSDRGLVEVSLAGDDLTETRVHALEGPGLAVRMRDGVATVALGSMGAAVVDLTVDPMVTLRALTPPGVVVDVDLRGDVLLVAMLSGTQLYGVRQDRLIPGAFWRANYVQLAGMLTDAGALLLDWESLVYGGVAWGDLGWQLDVPRGYHLRPGEDLNFPMRNPGPLPRDVEIGVFTPAQNFFGAEGRLEAGETSRLTIPASALAGSLDPVTRVTAVEIRLVNHTGPLVDYAKVVVMVRDPARDPANGLPALGDPMSELHAVAAGGGSTFALPFAGERTRIVFYEPVCAAMWPELEDLAWRAARGRLDERVAYLSTNDPATGFGAGYGAILSDPGFIGWAATDVPLLETLNAHLGFPTYLAFDVVHIPGGANHPTDYVVDALGRVESIHRLYRGAHPLE